MKTKINLLIKGNLIAGSIALASSARAEQSRAEQSRAEQSRADIICDKNIDNYDLSEAIIIEGDICVKSFISPTYVLVTGYISVKGGSCASE